MGQITKPVCICASVCVSLRLCTLSWSHLLIDFHQNWHRCKNPKSKNEFVWGKHHTTLTLFCAQNPQEVLKIHVNITEPILALNVCELPKFPCLLGNQGGGTWQWRHILDWKWKYGCFVHAQSKIYNITIICVRITEIAASYRKLGLRNMMMTLDFKLEVEI